MQFSFSQSHLFYGNIFIDDMISFLTEDFLSLMDYINSLCVYVCVCVCMYVCMYFKISMAQYKECFWIRTMQKAFYYKTKTKKIANFLSPPGPT